MNKTLFMANLADINDGNIEAMNAYDERKNWRGMDMRHLWLTLVMARGTKSFDGHIDFILTWEAYTGIC